MPQIKVSEILDNFIDLLHSELSHLYQLMYLGPRTNFEIQIITDKCWEKYIYDKRTYNITVGELRLHYGIEIETKESLAPVDTINLSNFKMKAKTEFDPKDRDLNIKLILYPRRQLYLPS